MGCRKEKINKFLLAGVLVTMLGVAISPLVMAATEDTLIVTFNPSGAVDIAIAPATYDFGSLTGGANQATTGDYITIWNNGTVFMDVQAKSNASTLNLTLDTDGSPSLDFFSINFNEANSTGYCTAAYGTEFWTNVGPSGDTRSFDFTLYLGSISTDHPEQNTTITFQGSIA